MANNPQPEEHWTDLDLLDNELLHARAENVTALAAGTPTPGRLIYDPDDETLKVGDGTGWIVPTAPPATGAARHTHVQSTLASTWNVTHNLNCHPQVSVEDAAGSVLYGTVRYLSPDTLTITFAFTITGRANCS